MVAASAVHFGGTKRQKSTPVHIQTATGAVEIGRGTTGADIVCAVRGGMEQNLPRSLLPARMGKTYFPAVDGLRALAVLAVMIFHLDEEGLRGGFVGVDIFFVISGFVVTASVADRRFDTLRAFLAYFYARRLTRIYPALVVCLAATAALNILFIPKAWLSDAIETVGTAAFFGMSNIVLALDSNSYFSPKAIFNPFTHSWSLGVEEQFYFLFPLLMFALQRPGASLAWRKGVIGFITLLCFLSLASSAALTWNHWQLAFYLLPTRFWELGLGMLLCLTWETWATVLSRSGLGTAVLSSVSLVSLGISLWLPANAGFPFPLALLPVLGTAGLIMTAVAQPGSGAAKFFSAPGLVSIGKISYSLYLWHWPVCVLLRWTVGLESWLTYATALSATFVLADISYRFIETPFRRFQRQHRLSPAWMTAGGLAILVITVAGANNLLNSQHRLSLSQTRNAAVWYPDGGEIVSSRPGCTLERVKRSVAGASLELLTPQGCQQPATPGRLVVAGDSHTWAYSNLLHHYALETGRQVLIYALPGCSFIKFSSPAEPACAQVQTEIAKELGRTLTPADIVFLPSLRLARFQDQWGERPGPDAFAAMPVKIRYALAQREAKDALDWVAASGAHIVFEAPTPVFKAPPFRCADWYDAWNPACKNGLSVSRAEIDALRAPVLDAMRMALQYRPRASIWDPLPHLCTPQSCEAISGGLPLFFDGDHLSGHGNDVLLPHFRDAFDQYWARPSAGEKNG
jgi:peptidoglycan/LPS O-acetylase OafA/YrhL